MITTTTASNHVIVFGTYYIYIKRLRLLKTALRYNVVLGTGEGSHRADQYVPGW